MSTPEGHTLDDFDKKYTPDESIVSKHFEPGDGRLETFGEDRDKVIEIHNTTPKKLWTAVDGEDDHLVFLAGFHYVNRLYYIVTNEEWKDENEFYQEQFCCGEEGEPPEPEFVGAPV